ncbi:MAG: DUF4091 domain-containing protein [Lachnospiraceae bacterium]|nr:DUF4091 domain-containing protein [Lachnospiraceae bacterium]
MEFTIRQISSLEKIRQTDPLPCDEISKKTVLAGERFSYQICIRPKEISVSNLTVSVSAESDFGDALQLYLVKDAYMDKPVTDPTVTAEDYITLEPGFMPDILIPLKEQKFSASINGMLRTFWIRLDVPADAVPGTYPVTIKLVFRNDRQYGPETYEKTMLIEVLPVSVPEQKLIYTRWFYADCIADQHNVPVFSEEHWALMDKYIAAAADLGINMILVPVHTPPLDTAIGTARPCVQLVDIEKKGGKYFFSFEKFRRFIGICQANGIQYFEIAHMFSQWGAKCAPNIQVTQNGKTDYMFGWHVAANSPEYVNFLKQYIAAIYQELEHLGISANTYFHISDEPSLDNMETYKAASDLFRPLIGNSKTFDALSNYDFYEKGLVECPVTSVEHIHEFLKHNIENQWTYYCCGPQKVFTNGFMAMPSYRTRILGYLLYKYDIKGFLHWGYNFYNSVVSYYPINPYLTTSGDGAYPSGDPFIVYPAKDGIYHSIRGQVMYEAIQDMDICFALEKYIGRDAVVAMIDRAAGMDLRFDEYPRSKEFLENLRAEMIEKIRETC